MRAAIRSLLLADVELVDIIEDRFFVSGSVDALEDVPALIVRYLEVTPAPTGEEPVDGATTVQFFMHDRQGDYHRIKAALRRVRTVLTTNFHVSGSDGVFVHARWNGDGPDGRDDGYNTLVKDASYSILAR